jgi:hypothetical protein
MTIEAAICYWLTGFIAIFIYAAFPKVKGEFAGNPAFKYPFLSLHEQFTQTVYCCGMHWLIGFGMLWAFLEFDLGQPWLILFVPLLLSSIFFTEALLYRLNRERKLAAELAAR